MCIDTIAEDIHVKTTSLSLASPDWVDLFMAGLMSKSKFFLAVLGPSNISEFPYFWS